MNRQSWSVLCIFLGMTLSHTANAWQAPPSKPPVKRISWTAKDGRFKLERGFFQHIARDQKRFWSSPLQIEAKQRVWFVPAAGLAAGLLYKDVDLSHDFQLRPSRVRQSQRFSDLALMATVGAAGSTYLWGKFTKNDRMRETGWLAGEAMTNSLLVGSALKYSLQRTRPFSGAKAGDFFSGGDSFPSNHALLTWSAASVFAHEYPGPLTRMLAYGVASAVSITRVAGQKHFPSDVVIGSFVGWTIGRQVYRSRHDPELGGVDIGKIVKDPPEQRSMSSTFIPLDAWIYPAIERAAALGYVSSAISGMKPWTRSEVRRLTEDLGEEIFAAGELANEEVKSIHRRLRREFDSPYSESAGSGSQSFVLDSVYVRSVSVVGTPLRDSLHFGQTIANDFGRPYGEGANAYTGFSVRGVSGSFSMFVRAEFQHATQGPVPDASARMAIATVDAVASGRDPALFQPPLIPYSKQDRVRVLEAYGTITLNNWSLSVGNQSVAWGPGRSPMLMSNNAEPVTMIRITNPTPKKLPWLLGLLGPMKTDYFFGRVRGHRFVSPEFREPAIPVRQPYIQGQKISFKPTPNLEIGFGRSVLFGGNRFPLTTRTFFRSLFSRGNETNPTDPGDRRSSFDFSYRIPGLRDWLTLYGDSLADDEITPLVYPRRSAMAPGLYLSRLPKIPKLDFRAEGAYTNLPGLRDPGFFYFNQRYRSGYTNNGNLLGNTIGRQGYGFRLESTYWFSPLTNLTLYHQMSKADKSFLGGGGQNTFGFRANYIWNDRVVIQATTQVQRWKFPVLGPSPKINGVISLQATYRPK